MAYLMSLKTKEQPSKTSADATSSDQVTSDTVWCGFVPSLNIQTSECRADTLRRWLKKYYQLSITARLGFQFSRFSKSRLLLFLEWTCTSSLVDCPDSVWSIWHFEFWTERDSARLKLFTKKLNFFADPMNTRRFFSQISKPLPYGKLFRFIT